MQVYKVFFRILGKQKGQIIMYLCIFLGVASLVSSQGDKDINIKLFEAESYPIAVFDEDGTEASRSFISYLSKGNQKVDIRDEKETIQDELYNRNISCAIRIPRGFETSLAETRVKEIELTTIPGTVYGQTFKIAINQYVTMVRSYLAGGFSLTESLERSGDNFSQSISVSMTENGKGASHSKLYYFFAYLPYFFIAVCVVGIGPILIVFHKKEVRERNSCSSYSLTRMNAQLFGGVITAGLGLCVFYCLMVIMGTGTEIFSVQGLLYGMNMLSFMMVSLGIVFLLGEMVQSVTAISMISNVLALGMSFLCGIFVPLEFLSDGLVRAAHFLPAYWYIVSADFIDRYVPGDSMTELWSGLGIQLLFGVALVSVGLAYSRIKRTSAEG